MGKVTQEKLVQMGLLTCQDVQQSSQTVIYQEFGKFGQRLWDFCHGIDIREVEVDRPRKSLAVENTLLQDINTLAQAELIIDELYHKLLFRIQRNWADTPLHEFKKTGHQTKNLKTSTKQRLNAPQMGLNLNDLENYCIKFGHVEMSVIFV